ncbi:MAG: STAS domain-containing protein, partial [Pseudomonadota bacterium]
MLPKMIEDDCAAGSRRIRLTGRVTVRFIEDISPYLRELEHDTDPLLMCLGGIERIDTTGAWVLYRLREERAARGLDTVFENLDPRITRLLEQVGEANQTTEIRPDLLPVRLQVLEKVGRWVSAGVHEMGTFLDFLGVTLLSALKVLFRPSRMRWNATFAQADTVGVSALGIIGLMTFLVGIVVAQQGAVQLRQFGAEVFVTNLV